MVEHALNIVYKACSKRVQSEEDPTSTRGGCVAAS